MPNKASGAMGLNMLSQVLDRVYRVETGGERSLQDYVSDRTKCPFQWAASVIYIGYLPGLLLRLVQRLLCLLSTPSAPSAQCAFDRCEEKTP